MAEQQLSYYLVVDWVELNNTGTFQYVMLGANVGVVAESVPADAVAVYNTGEWYRLQILVHNTDTPTLAVS